MFFQSSIDFIKRNYIISGVIGGIGLCLIVLRYRAMQEEDDKSPTKEKFMQINGTNFDKAHGTFYKETEGNPILSYYWSSSCGHCKAFSPVWKQFVAYAKKKYPTLIINEIQADSVIGKDKARDAVDREIIDGYPSIVFNLQNRNNLYEGNRELPMLTQWLDVMMPLQRFA